MPQLWPDEVRVRVETLNLDAASYRQLRGAHTADDGTVDGAAVRAEVLAIVAERGKMQNPVTGSGGMLIGTVDEVGPDSPLGLAAGDQVATLVSLSLTPLQITDGLERLGRAQRAGARRGPRDPVRPLDRREAARRPRPRAVAHGHGRLRRAGARAPASSSSTSNAGTAPTVAVIGGAGKSGSLALAAARDSGAAATVGIVPVERERALLLDAGLADHVALADARDPVALSTAVRRPWAARPTSRSCASTSRAASTARCWPRATAAR